jgi:hypothetical protein
MPRPADHPYGERVLQIDPPITGRDVWDLQIKLIGWGSGSDNDGIGFPMMPVRVTGKFDAATRDAVKRFQTALNLPVTGVVDTAVFRAIDAEAALYPVLVNDLRCPCARGKNTGEILCRCEDHPQSGSGVCAGFGHARFAGQYLLTGKQLADGTHLDSETLDVYDKQEYPGMDKAVIWAVRALMRRANVNRIRVVEGYRCWHDNYHHYGKRRWIHRTGTFHFGKTVEFYHDGTCQVPPPNPPAICNTCNAIRTIALNKCGFQPRWQEADRVSVGDVSHVAQPPRNAFAVMVSTVRRRERPIDEFVQTFRDSTDPRYGGNVASLSFPLKYNNADSLDPRQGSAQMYFTNSERGPGGQFPIGASRVWHGGIHLFRPAGTEVYAIANGEIVGCRVGEAVNVEPYGSRNFVLIRHTWKNVIWYSLYMHLDNGAANALSPVPWRKRLHELTADHVEMDAPCPLFTAQNPGPQGFLQPEAGLAAGEWRPLVGGAVAADPRVGGPALDTKAPPNSQVISVVVPAGNRYVFLQMENQVLGRRVDANAAVTNAIANTTPVGLASPIPVNAGELLGYVAAAPTDNVLSAHGTFLHLEVFSATQLLTGAGIAAIQIASENDVVSRSDAVAKLKNAHLLDGPPDDVLLDTDFTADNDRQQIALRGVQLRCRSAWKMDWQAALTNSATRWQMQAGARNTIGGHMNNYRWWDDVNGNNRLPASPDVWHAHPISWLMFLSNEMYPAPA